MTPITSSSEWHTIAASLPHAHLLQSWQWGEFKSRYGWQATRFIWKDAYDAPVAAAQILSRSVAPRGRLSSVVPAVLYIPKGPLLDWGNTPLRQRVLDDIQAYARKHRAIFVKLDPDLPLGFGVPQTETEAPHPVGQETQHDLEQRGWQFSPDQIQFHNTVTLDLTRTEDAILAAMKQKTRYNVRLAEKKGVSIRLGTSADLDLLYKMYAETSVRDGFVIRHAAYYKDAWGTFMKEGLAQPLIAEVEGQAISAIIVFSFGGRALYMYGMSTNQHRDKMPNHLLQWEAMRWSKAHACHTYDFWGAPDEFVESDSMWGVWKFKEGFNGTVERHLGAWDYAPSKMLYRLYTIVLPKVLDVMRRRRKLSVISEQ